MTEWQWITSAHTTSAFALAWIGQALFYGTLLAAVTWAVLRLTRKRVSPAFEAAAWTIVLLKFLLPMGPALPFSLAGGVGKILHVLPAQSAIASNTGMVVTDLADSASAADGSVLHASAPLTNWRTILVAAYFGGVLVLLAVRVRGYRAIRACCRDLPDVDPLTFDLVRGVCRRLGVRRTPIVKLSDELPAPFVMGLINPILVLSRRQLVRPNELETVIVHEVTHLRRGDLIVRCLQGIAGTLLFFWPVVAWVNRRIDTAREYACDQWALRHGKLTAGEYARCLLDAVQPLRATRLAYRPACMAGRHSNIERRIDVILESTVSPRRARFWSLTGAAFLFAWGVFVLSGAAQAEDLKKSWSPTPEDVKQRNAEMIQFVSQNEYVDADGDGEVTVPEKHVYLVALAVVNGDAVLKQFPDVDRNQDGKLGVGEAYDLARGGRIDGSEIKKLLKKAKQADEEGDPQAVEELKKKAQVAEMTYWHLVMDDQQWLLDNLTSAPDAEVFQKVNLKVDSIRKEEQVKSEKKIKLKSGETQNKATIAEELRKKIAELEANGQHEKAAELKQKLEQLEKE